MSRGVPHLPDKNAPWRPAPHAGALLEDLKPNDPFVLSRPDRSPHEPETTSRIGASPASGYRRGDLLSRRYQLVRILGDKGGATVWVVQDTALDVQLALKMISQADGDPRSAERMLSEARAVARIEHPAIARVLDFGVTDQNDPFVVTELVSGVSVRDRIDRETCVPVIDAIRLLLPIADGLSVAHSLGVVHGGISPEAIVCVSEGGDRCQPKLMDFGMGDDNAPRRLGYPSPEPVQGPSDVGYETDVRSFCAVLYEMVTGAKPLFRAGDGNASWRAVEGELAPPISGFGIDDPELSSVLVRGLRPSSAGGFCDMHSLGVVLARWLLRHGIEEDVTTQSVRAVWLEAGSSTPPTALDLREGAERSIAAALAERVDIPKRSAFRPVLGIAAGVLTLALIGVAGIYTVRGSSHRETPPAATRVLASPDPQAPVASPPVASPLPEAPVVSLPSEVPVVSFPPEVPAPSASEAEQLVRSKTALASPVPKAAVPKAKHGVRAGLPPQAPKRMYSTPAFPAYDLSPDVSLPSADDGDVAPNAGAPPPAADNPDHNDTDQAAGPPASSENPY